MGAAADPAFEETHPALAEYLTLIWDGQRRRQTCTLLLMADEGMWKGCLSDRDHDLVLWASAATLAGVYASLEASLASGDARWREKRPYKR